MNGRPEAHSSVSTGSANENKAYARMNAPADSACSGSLFQRDIDRLEAGNDHEKGRCRKRCALQHDHPAERIDIEWRGREAECVAPNLISETIRRIEQKYIADCDQKAWDCDVHGYQRKKQFLARPIRARE